MFPFQAMNFRVLQDPQLRDGPCEVQFCDIPVFERLRVAQELLGFHARFQGPLPVNLQCTQRVIGQNRHAAVLDFKKAAGDVEKMRLTDGVFELDFTRFERGQQGCVSRQNTDFALRRGCRDALTGA